MSNSSATTSRSDCSDPIVQQHINDNLQSSITYLASVKRHFPVDRSDVYLRFQDALAEFRDSKYVMIPPRAVFADFRGHIG